MNTKGKVIKKYLAIFSIILLFGATFFTGCDNPNDPKDPEKIENNDDPEEKKDPVKDDTGDNKNPAENTGKIQDAIDNAVAGTTVVLSKDMEGTELSITKAMTVNGNGLKDISISVDAQISGNVKLKNFRNAKVSIKENEEERAKIAGSARSAYGAFEEQPVTLSEDEQLDQEIKSAQELFGSIYGDEHRFTVEDCTFEELNIEEDIALMISTKGANPCEFEKINVKEGVEDFYIIEKDYDDAATEEKGKIKELNFESNLSDFAMVGAVVEDVKYDEKADFRFVYDEETTELPSEVQEKVKEELDAKDIQYTGILDDKNVISGSKYYISFPRNLYLTTFDDICIYFFTKESIEEATADPYSNRYVVYGRNALKTTNITYDEFGCEHFDIVNGLYIPFNPDRTVVKDYHVYQRRNAQAISGLYFELTDDTVTYYLDLEKLKSTDIRLEGSLWNGYYIDKLTPVNLAGYAPYASVTVEGGNPDNILESNVYGGMFELLPCPDSEWPTEAEFAKAITNFEDETFGGIDVAYVDQEHLFREFEARVNGLPLDEVPVQNLLEDSFKKATETILNVEQNFTYVVKEDCKSIEMTLQDDTGDYWYFVQQPTKAPVEKFNFEFDYQGPYSKEINLQEIYEKAYAEAEAKFYASLTLARTTEPKTISLPGDYKKDVKYTFTFKYHVDTTDEKSVERKVYWKSLEEENLIEFLPMYKFGQFEYLIPDIWNTDATEIDFEKSLHVSNPYIKIYRDKEATKEYKDVSEIKPYLGYWTDIYYINGDDIESYGYEPIYVYDITPYVKPVYRDFIKVTPNVKSVAWNEKTASSNYEREITSFAENEKVYLDKEKTKLFSLDNPYEVKSGDTVYVDNGSFDNYENEYSVYVVTKDGKGEITIEELSFSYNYFNGIYKNYWKDEENTIPFTPEDLENLPEILSAKDENGNYVITEEYCIYDVDYSPAADSLLNVYVLTEGADKSVKANWILTTMQRSELLEKASEENIYVFNNFETASTAFDSFSSIGIKDDDMQTEQVEALTGRTTEECAGKEYSYYDPYDRGTSWNGPVYLYTDNEVHLYILEFGSSETNPYSLETLIDYVENGNDGQIYFAYKDYERSQNYTIAELQALAVTPGFHSIFVIYDYISE